MAVRVGTSGWAYTAWKPGFYPTKLPSKRFLEYYASQLNAVEANYTFRRYLTEEIIDGWLAQTPAGFHFAVKAHQSLTHMRRLKNCDEPLARFVDSLAPLKKARRLAPVLFQLPPNFKGDPQRLAAFLELLPRTLRVAFEFRHESWFMEEVYSVLKRRHAALCVAETDDFQTPRVFTAEFAYFRLRKSNYSPAARKKIADALRSVTRETPDVSVRDVYAFFKHEENPKSPNWAREVLNQAVKR